MFGTYSIYVCPQSIQSPRLRLRPNAGKDLHHQHFDDDISDHDHHNDQYDSHHHNLQIEIPNECKPAVGSVSAGEDADAWWCKAIVDMQDGENIVNILNIVDMQDGENISNI